MCGFEPRWEYVFTAAEALTVMHTLRTGEMRVQVLPAALGALVDESRRAVGLDYSSQGHGLVGGLRQTRASLSSLCSSVEERLPCKQFVRSSILRRGSQDHRDWWTCGTTARVARTLAPQPCARGHCRHAGLAQWAERRLGKSKVPGS